MIFFFCFVIFVCCFFASFQGFFKDGVAREGETTLALAAFSCCYKTLSLHKCHLFFCCNIFWFHRVVQGVGLVTQCASGFFFFLPPRATTTPAEPKFSISAWTQWVWPSSSARRSSSSCRRSVKGCGSSWGCSKEAAPSLGIWKELGVFSPHKKLQVGCWLLVLGMHLFIRVAEELAAEADGGIADGVLDGVVIWKMQKAGLMQGRVNVWWQSCGSMVEGGWWG